MSQSADYDAPRRRDFDYAAGDTPRSRWWMRFGERRREQKRGLYGKYRVTRINDAYGKHDDCRYFVLDPQHDHIAREALARYAEVAREQGYGPLAEDLDLWLSRGTSPADSDGAS